MDNPRTIRTPDELERLIRRYLHTETFIDIRLKCPETFLYTKQIKRLLQTGSNGHRPWFSYDREHCVFKLLAMARPIHDAISMLAGAFMTSVAVTHFIPPPLQRKITISTKGYLMTRTLGPESGSKIQGWTKYPDLSIVFRGADQPLPVVVFETGFSESYVDLKNDATQWLLRSGGKVRLVVMVDIKEDIKKRQSLQKEPAAQNRLRQLVRSFGSNFAKAKHGVNEPEDDTDMSDPDMYDSIRSSIVVKDWVGPISADMELWELCGGDPMVRERTTVLPRPESPKNPMIKITDLIPPAYCNEVENFNPNLVHEIDLDYYRELLLDSFREHAFHRAVTLLREKHSTIDSTYIPPQT